MSVKTIVASALSVPLKYPTGQGGDTAVEFAIDPAKARDAFAGDLSDEQAALIAATQRPASELAFSEPTGAPAWRRLPFRAVVATGDRAAGTDVIRAEAERAGATITELEGSHVIMISQPQAVTEVIEAAIAQLGSAAMPENTSFGPLQPVDAGHCETAQRWRAWHSKPTPNRS